MIMSSTAATTTVASPGRQSPLAAYRTFLLSNATQISSVEQALRSLSYFLPGRFADADLASESLFALVNLVSLYHDQILYDAVQHASPPDFKPSLINQYHRWWQAKSPLVHYASMALTIVQTVESVCEMTALKKHKPRTRWNVVLGIESAKALLRLLIVSRTHQPTLSPAIPDAIHGSAGPYKGARSGVTLPSVDAMGSAANVRGVWDQYLAAKAVRTAFRSPADLLAVLKGSRTLGEILFILRPVIYVYLMRKHGRKAWLPLAVSFVVELVAYLLVTKVNGRGAMPGTAAHKVTRLEKDEYSRRAYLFLYYLLRGPVYDGLTKHALDSFCGAMSNKPILRLFSGIIRDYQPLWENVYMYTSGSG
ncbi:peroxisome membrane protein [Catenaria anguillulae PL171]|uniref:Peroxisomal membrane protein PEX16 n=1 Tax=Catenaria anguillulae PL171 TaxID=765915 RepID=A0A1Y2HW85_9FUNG|nr:peroxisome membrane protein [Catenaria anguillulae PL171]